MRSMSAVDQTKICDTQGIVLAGVHHWNDRSLDGAVPRALAPIALVPAVGYVLRWMADGGIRDITLCAHSATRVTYACLADGAAFGARLRYCEDRAPRGPAGCVRDVVRHSNADRFIVSDGCHLPCCDIEKLVATHVASGAAMTVLLTSFSPDANRNDTRLRPAGVYVIERSATEHIADVGYQDIKEELLPRLRAAGLAVLPYVIHDRVFRLGGLHRYLAAHERVVTQVVRGEMIGPNFERLGGSMVHRSADISAGCRLVGPCIIGPQAQLGAGTLLVGPTVVGKAAAVRDGAVVLRSAIWDGGRIEGDARVDGSVVAHGATVAAHETLAGGLRLPRRGRWQPAPQVFVWNRRRTQPESLPRESGEHARASATTPAA